MRTLKPALQQISFTTMTIHKYIALLLVTCLFFLHGISQDGISFSRWQKSPVLADGQNNEWRKPLNLYDAITGLLFSVANDSSNLYVCVTANDERKITKLMRAGWMLALSSKEKNKKFESTISFPGIQSINEPGKDEGVTQVSSPDFKGQTSLYRLTVQSVAATGFVTENGNIALNTPHGINIGIGADSTQEIIFEFAIPFKELVAANNLSLNEELTLGITVRALKRPKYHGDPDGKDLVKTSHKKGREGAAAAGVPVDRSYLYTEIDFKQKFRLSSK